jgi:hypothetical protein
MCNWVKLPRTVPLFWGDPGEGAELFETTLKRNEGEIVFIETIEAKPSEVGWHLAIALTGKYKKYYVLLADLDKDIRGEMLGWANAQHKATEAASPLQQAAGRANAKRLRTLIELMFYTRYYQRPRVVA